MITKIIDNFIYFTGLSTLGILAVFWDKKLVITNKVQNKSWMSSLKSNKLLENRTIIYFKYGIIPDYVVYQEREDKIKENLEWKNINENKFDITKFYNYLSFKNLLLNLNIEDTEIKNSSYFDQVRRI